MAMAAPAVTANAQGNNWLKAAAPYTAIEQSANAGADARQKAGEDQSLILGYCSTEMPSEIMKVGMNITVTVQAAIKIPGSKALALKGNKISKVCFATESSMTTVYAWIKETDLTKPAVSLKKVDKVVKGWNEVTLDTPYEITGEDIYIGFMAKQPADVMGIWFDPSMENENAAYVKGGSGSFESLYGKEYGTLLIYGVVNGAKLPDYDLALNNLALDKEFYKPDHGLNFTIDLRNEGTKDISAYKVSYSIDGQTPVSEASAEKMAAGSAIEFGRSVDISTLDEGMHKFTVFVGDVADGEQAITANDTLTTDFAVYKSDYPRNLLLEQFTTMSCSNCPYGSNTLLATVYGRDDIVWVAHHVGFLTDQFTIDESEDLLNFGITGAPMAMINRTRIPTNTESDYPPVGIGYRSATNGAKVLTGYMDYCAAIPAFAKTTTTTAWDAGTRLLTVTVEGEANNLLDKFYPETNLSVYLIENKLLGDYAQAGADKDYVHNHVIRAMLTGSMGEAITWSNGKFSRTLTYTLDEGWNEGNMKVVTFINKPFDGSAAQRNNAEVVNAEESSISGTSGIKGITDSGNAQVESVVYSLDGTTAAQGMMKKGVYIVRSTAGGHATSRKVVVR